MAFALGFALAPPATRAAPPPGYYLVWADEFDGPELDLTKWSHRNLGLRGDAIVTADAVSLTNGHLVITTYTSNGLHFNGMVGTQGKFSARYGYFEAAIDFDSQPGMWSAFWLQSPTINNPRYFGNPGRGGVEMDICEHRAVNREGSNVAGQVQVNFHWNGYGPEHQELGGTLIGQGLDQGFHTYGFLWTKTNCSVAINGEWLWQTNHPISHRSQFIILSSEIRGQETRHWAGWPPPGGYGCRETSLARMRVDHVRYYAPKKVSFWRGGTTARWTVPANWAGGRVPASGDELVLSSLGGSHARLELAGPVRLDRLSLWDTPRNYTLTGPHTLELGAGGLDLAARGDLRLETPVRLAAPQTWEIPAGRTVTVAGALDQARHLTLTGGGTLALRGAAPEADRIQVADGRLDLARHNAAARPGAARPAASLLPQPVVKLTTIPD